jgi:hypothetical protein
MRISSRVASLLPVFAFVSFAAGSARAQDAAVSSPTPAIPASSAPVASATVEAPPESRTEGYEKAGGEHREVNGHRFITPTFEGFSAFTNSSILFEQGFGLYSANFTQNTHIPTVGKVQPELFQYRQLLGGQIAIANRVSIDIRARGSADVGSNIKNLLALGVIADVEAGAMPKLRVFTLEKVGLTFSVGANIEFEHAVSLSPLSIVSALANSQKPSKGIAQINDYVISPVAMLAEGIGPFGLQIAAFPRLANGDFKQNDVFLDFHVAIDIQRITKHVPVALTFEYEPDIFLSDALKSDKGSLSNQLAGGIYYSGRRDFSVGAIFQYATVKATGQDADQFAVLMTMQYFF